MNDKFWRRVIAAHERVPRMRLATCMCGWEEPIRGRDVTALHAAHVADALRESRTARTVEELDALPHLSLVRELGKYGAVWERRDETVCSHRWEQIAGDALSMYPRIPARVLYRPDENGAL
ncbi:hypothetical protein [Gordonia iterans]